MKAFEAIGAFGVCTCVAQPTDLMASSVPQPTPMIIIPEAGSPTWWTTTKTAHLGSRGGLQCFSNGFDSAVFKNRVRLITNSLIFG